MGNCIYCSLMIKIIVIAYYFAGVPLPCMYRTNVLCHDDDDNDNIIKIFNTKYYGCYDWWVTINGIIAFVL